MGSPGTGLGGGGLSGVIADGQRWHPATGWPRSPPQGDAQSVPRGYPVMTGAWITPARLRLLAAELPDRYTAPLVHLSRARVLGERRCYSRKRGFRGTDLPTMARTHIACSVYHIATKEAESSMSLENRAQFSQRSMDRKTSHSIS